MRSYSSKALMHTERPDASALRKAEWQGCFKIWLSRSSTLAPWFWFNPTLNSQAQRSSGIWPVSLTIHLFVLIKQLTWFPPGSSSLTDWISSRAHCLFFSRPYERRPYSLLKASRQYDHFQSVRKLDGLGGSTFTFWFAVHQIPGPVHHGPVGQFSVRAHPRLTHGTDTRWPRTFGTSSYPQPTVTNVNSSWPSKSELTATH